jgi:thiol-disulfide isomerase/thioredoxin
MTRTALKLAVALAVSLNIFAAEPSETPVLPVGSPCPDFKLPGVDGKTYSLKDFAAAKVLAIIFTCDHCPTAQAYESRIKKLATDYTPRGVAVVAINPNSPAAVRFDELGYTDLDDSFESMKIRAKQREFNFPYLDDGPTESFAKKLGPTATPHVFIFDADRKLRFQGRIDDSEREEYVKTRDTRAALDALLEGRTPAVQQTKVFGCSTKWDSKIEGNQRWIEKVHKEPVTVAPITADQLKELRANKTGKVVLINFWATWCGPCVAEFDDLIETNLRFRHRDFELITVAAQFPDEKDQVLRFLQKHFASNKNYYFGDTDKYKMIEAFDPDWNGAVPHTLLLGPNGEVLYRETSDLNILELRRKIYPALNKITPWPGLSDAK